MFVGLKHTLFHDYYCHLVLLMCRRRGPWSWVEQDTNTLIQALVLNIKENKQSSQSQTSSFASYSFIIIFFFTAVCIVSCRLFQFPHLSPQLLSYVFRCPFLLPDGMRTDTHNTLRYYLHKNWYWYYISKTDGVNTHHIALQWLQSIHMDKMETVTKATAALGTG